MDHHGCCARRRQEGGRRRQLRWRGGGIEGSRSAGKGFDTPGERAEGSLERDGNSLTDDVRWMQGILAESVSSSSWPGLSRLRGRSPFGGAKAWPSTSWAHARKKDVDARASPGHDEPAGGDAT